jgi:hypothetical protein
LSGWIKLYRQLLTNGWFRNHKLLVFWIYCLLKASHKPSKVTAGYQVIPLEPGQFIFGRRKASAETKLSEQEIRSCLSFLKSSKNLTLKTTNKFSIISIVNWERYQGNNHQDQPAKQPAKNPQLTTFNNGENGKNKKASAQRRIEENAIPCPADLRPDFLKEN